MRTTEEISPKVKALYEAVEELIFENVDVKGIKVSDITERAGIGKGTAYEYFRNKEEIIGSAMLYHIDLICRQMMDKIEELGNFSEAMQFILASIDAEIKKRDCFIQFIHLISDNGSIGKVLQAKIKEKDRTACMPKDVIDRMIEIGTANGEISKELPTGYISLQISGSIITYIIYVINGGDKQGCSKKEMHRLICRGMGKALR